MSALGHKRTYVVQKGMSALPPIADIALAMRFGIKSPPTEAVSIIHGFAQIRTI